MKTELPVKMRLDTSVIRQQLQELENVLENLIIALEQIEKEGNEVECS